MYFRRCLAPDRRCPQAHEIAGCRLYLRVSWRGERGARSEDASRCAFDPAPLRCGAVKKVPAKEVRLVELAGAELAYPPQIVQQRRNRFTVTDDLDRQVRQALQRQKRTPGIFLISAVLLAAIAAAVGYFWLNYNNRIRSASFAGQPAVAPVAASGEETVLLKDFHSFQQQAADSLRSAAQDIAAQKTDLKSLSDQVSALSAKIDAMQSAEQPTGSASAPVDVRSGSQQLAVPARTFAVGARKRLPAPKASGPISVGGAALPPPTDR
jgi:hypothetical protein